MPMKAQQEIQSYNTKNCEHWSRICQVPKETVLNHNRDETLKQKMKSFKKMMADFQPIAKQTNLPRLEGGNIYSFMYPKYT